MSEEPKQPYVYDFTLDYSLCELSVMKKTLTQIAKKWVFQQEEGKGGYVHWQGRFSLKKRLRVVECFKLAHSFDGWATMHVSPTSKKAAKKAIWSYVMKPDRIAGPYSDKDVVLYVPRHIKKWKNDLPFQATLFKMAEVRDDRGVDYVYCPNGNKGKSVFVGKARALGYRCLPPVFDYKDILRMVYCVPTSKCYIIDMPRAIKQNKMAGFFSGIETIKDGYAYDDRHTFKEKTFDAPRIFLFSNRLPEKGHLSADRWNIWTIDDSLELVKYVPIVPALV